MDFGSGAAISYLLTLFVFVLSFIQLNSFAKGRENKMKRSQLIFKVFTYIILRSDWLSWQFHSGTWSLPR